MPKDQFEKWFSNERLQITSERKQKLLSKFQQQQQQEEHSPLQTQFERNVTIPHEIQHSFTSSSSAAAAVAAAAVTTEQQFGSGDGDGYAGELQEQTLAPLFRRQAIRFESIKKHFILRKIYPLIQKFKWVFIFDFLIKLHQINKWMFSKLRGLRLTEGTDAVLQCDIFGIPRPKVHFLDFFNQISLFF